MSDAKPSKAVSVALIVVGLVILIPSGLCTGVMIVGTLVESAGDFISMLPTVLIVGGPFVLGGGLLVYAGIRRIKAARKDERGGTVV